MTRWRWQWRPPAGRVFAVVCAVWLVGGAALFCVEAVRYKQKVAESLFTRPSSTPMLISLCLWLGPFAIAFIGSSIILAVDWLWHNPPIRREAE